MEAPHSSHAVYLHTTLRIDYSGMNRPLFHPLILVSVALAWLSLIAIGCTDTKNDIHDTFSDDAVEITDSPTSSSDLTQSVADSKKPSGGIFRFPGYFALVPDPVFAEHFDGMLVAELYSGLTKIVDDPSAPVQPDLADRWSISDDGTTYEFVLKQNLKFSDGSPVTASDFKWSWERALDPRMESHHAKDAFRHVVGAAAVIDGTSKDISGVQVVDDRTLRVELQNPRTDFPALLADPVASVLKRENVEKWNYDLTGWWSDPQRVPVQMDEMPVGTGPFKLAAFHANDKSVILRNEHYVGRPAYLDGVEFTMTWPDGVSWHDFNSEGFRNQSFDAVLIDEDSIRGVSILIEEPPESRFFLFNASLSPYDHKSFRRALIAASNKQPFVETRYTEGEVATAILPPQLTTHESRLKGLGYDPELAIAELAASGYAETAEELRLEFHESAFGRSEEEIHALSQNWKDILGVNLRYVPTYPSRLQQAYENNEVQIAFKRIHAQYPDPDAILRVFIDAFGHGNQSPEYLKAESLIHIAASESDAARRLSLYSDAERYILEEALAMPFAWLQGSHRARVQDWVHGFNIPKYHGSTFANVWFDKTAPERALP